MSETPKHSHTPEETPEPKQKEAAPSAQERTAKPATPEKKQENGHSASVFTYLAILFAVAFLLLLLAYFIQQRNNSVAMEGLRDSISSFESLDALLDENRSLREENELLEQQLETLQGEHAQLQADKDDLEIEYELEHEYAVSWETVWELETLFRQARYEECVQQLQNMYYSTFYRMPQSAQERVQEIQDTLLDLGYLSVQYTYTIPAE